MKSHILAVHKRTNESSASQQPLTRFLACHHGEVFVKLEPLLAPNMSYFACQSTRPVLRHKFIQQSRLLPIKRSLATRPDDQDDWLPLLNEASALSRSLYRRCFRSIRHIRHGNEHDEAEFQRREEERLEKLDDQQRTQRDPRLSMLSMLPPVNRKDELRSRAEYYQQYTRENFVQESDCLEHAVLREGHVERFVYLVRRGDDNRKWLLKDMKFDDPCSDKDQEAARHRLEDFESKARALILRWLGEATAPAASSQAKDDDDVFWDDDDEDDDTSQGLPGWYKNPRR
jgi:hypothetical protein